MNYPTPAGIHRTYAPPIADGEQYGGSIRTDGGSEFDIEVSVGEDTETITLYYDGVGVGYQWEGEDDSGRIRRLDASDGQLVFAEPADVCGFTQIGSVSVDDSEIAPLRKVEEQELESFSKWLRNERERELEFEVVRENGQLVFTPRKEALNDYERRRLDALKASNTTDVGNRLHCPPDVELGSRHTLDEVGQLIDDGENPFDNLEHSVEDVWTEDDEQGEAWCAFVVVRDVRNNIEATYRVENRIGSGWQCYLETAQPSENFDRRARTYLRIHGPVDPSFRLPTD